MIPISEREINRRVDRLPFALRQYLSRELQVALVQKDYVEESSFPLYNDQRAWNHLQADCRFTNRQRNEVKNILYPMSQ